MKKHFGLLTASVLALSVFASGCSNQEAYDFYNDVTLTTAEAKIVESNYNMSIKMTMGDETVPMTVTGRAQTIQRNKDKFDMKMDMRMDILGEQAAINMYMKDNTIYMNDGAGMKVKMKADTNEFAATTVSPDLDLADLGIDETLIKNVEFGKSNGLRKLDVTVDGAIALDKIMGMMTMMDPTGELGLDELDDGSFTISDVRYIITANKQNLMQSEHMLFTIAVYDEELKAPIYMEFDMYMEYVYDRISSISFPDDLKSYEDISVFAVAAVNMDSEDAEAPVDVVVVADIEEGTALVAAA